eukprot:1133977-Pelagomonas_calceolata.AAC.2
MQRNHSVFTRKGWDLAPQYGRPPASVPLLDPAASAAVAAAPPHPPPAQPRSQCASGVCQLGMRRMAWAAHEKLVTRQQLQLPSDPSCSPPAGAKQGEILRSTSKRTQIAAQANQVLILCLF